MGARLVSEGALEAALDTRFSVRSSKPVAAGCNTRSGIRPWRGRGEKLPGPSRLSLRASCDGIVSQEPAADRNQTPDGESPPIGTGGRVKQQSSALVVVGRFRFGSSINRCWLGSPVRCRAGPLTFVHNLARRRLATQEPPSIHHHCGPTAETRDRRACYSPPAVPRNSNFLISSEPLPLLTVRPPSRGTSYPSSRRRRRRLSRSFARPVSCWLPLSPSCPAM